MNDLLLLLPLMLDCWFGVALDPSSTLLAVCWLVLRSILQCKARQGVARRGEAIALMHLSTLCI